MNLADQQPEQPIQFAGSELRAQRHIDVFSHNSQEEYQLLQEDPFFVPPDELLPEIQERGTRPESSH